MKKALRVIVPLILILAVLACCAWYLLVYDREFTKEMLLSDMTADYDPKTDTIYYEGGRGGVPPEIRVFDSEQNGDILTLYYHLYDGENGTIYSDRYYLLEIGLLDNGSFRYLSQKIIEKEN